MDETMEMRPVNRGRRIALAVTGGIVALIALVYLGLCIYVGASEDILPGVYAADVALGSMNQEQAQQAVEEWRTRQYDGETYVLQCGQSTAELPGSIAVVDSKAVAQAAYMVGREEPFLKRGAVILSHLMHSWSAVPCHVQLDAQGEQQVALALEELSKAEDVNLVESVWSAENNQLTIVRGTSGLYVDKELAKQALLEVMQTPGNYEVAVPMSQKQPMPLDLQQIHDQLYAQAADAYVEKDEQGGVRIVPHVVGIDFDVPQVQAQFDALPEAGRLQVPLTVTMPEMTMEKLQERLFVDVLGECTTNIGGTQYRLSNVIVAAEAMDGVILLPGDVFSYNDTLGPRTVANGYKPAPAYVGGKTVDEVGGGICQNSSTLYLAVLRANLEIVERTNHMYTVGYVPDGLDATVAWNALDFKFRNSTDYPIRIEAKVSGRNMIVKLYGAAEEKVTVKMERKTLSTTPYKVLYKPDASVAAGKTVVDTTAYTGKKIQVFRCVYDEQGNLLSRTQESMNNYRRRDKVILYNPADAASLGLVDANGVVHETVQPKPEPKPVEPETPTIAPQPEPTQPEAAQPEQEQPQVQQPEPVQPEQEQSEVQQPVTPEEQPASGEATEGV